MGLKSSLAGLAFATALGALPWNGATAEPATSGSPEPRHALEGAASVTALAGGEGGDPYILRCPSGQALVGLRVRAARFIERIRGICAVADGSGGETPSAGGDGGTATTLRCNDGRVVTGVRGRSGAHVDSLRLECGTPGGQDQPRTTDAAGGSGGAEFGPLRCRRDRIVVGLRGRASAIVDSLQLLCATRLPDTQRTTPSGSRAVGASMASPRRQPVHGERIHRAHGCIRWRDNAVLWPMSQLTNPTRKPT